MEGDKRLLAILSTLREDIEIVGTKEASIKVVGGYRGRNLRKLLEVTFRSMDLNLVLEDCEQEEIRAGTQKVIVKGGEKSYAKLLKQIKGSVDMKKEGIIVKSAKKTRGEDLILEVAGKEQAERLKKTIVARTEGNTVEDVRGYQVQVDIFDIDGDVTKEEILGQNTLCTVSEEIDEPVFINHGIFLCFRQKIYCGRIYLHAFRYNNDAPVIHFNKENVPLELKNRIKI
ncbi:unnamed protein product [Diabrotica balteata]|uniref:Uncharacterized protein n=1 Tax=Diabrotica balteata TaxID=107213 RepID=A0A9N9X9X7_DIABA|nr:unnamed protein product [Diabrotica balteata]